RARQGGAVELDAVEEAVPERRELDEAPFPDGLVTERLGVEARRELTAVAEADADPLRHRDLRAPEDPAEPRAELGPAPAAVGPGRLVLVAPVPERPAVEPGERREQGGETRLLGEVRGLLGVEVVEAVAVDVMPPVRPVLRAQGGSVKREGGRRVCLV